MNARVWLGHCPGFEYPSEVVSLGQEFGVVVEDWPCGTELEASRVKLSHSRVPHDEVMLFMCEPWVSLDGLSTQLLVDYGVSTGAELYRRSFVSACRVSREVMGFEPWLSVPGDFAGVVSEVAGYYGWLE